MRLQITSMALREWSICLGSATAGPAFYAGNALIDRKSLDALKAEPENHKVIFENEHVRVLEVTIALHSKEPIHAHCWPSTPYIQQAGDIIDRDANGKILFDSRQLKLKPKVPFAQWSPYLPRAEHLRAG